MAPQIQQQVNNLAPQPLPPIQQQQQQQFNILAPPPIQQQQQINVLAPQLQPQVAARRPGLRQNPQPRILQNSQTFSRR